MATATTPTAASNGNTSPAKPGLLAVLLPAVIGLIGALAGAAGIWLYLSHSGRLPGSSASAPAVAIVAGKPPATHSLALDPFLVNLADPSGRSYLRLVMMLRVADPQKGKDGKKAEEAAKPKDGKDTDSSETAEQKAALRDTALAVLSSQQPDVLLAADGKDGLKRQLEAAFAKYNPEVSVTAIYFTEFLVQR